MTGSPTSASSHLIRDPYFAKPFGGYLLPEAMSFAPASSRLSMSSEQACGTGGAELEPSGTGVDCRLLTRAMVRLSISGSALPTEEASAKSTAWEATGTTERNCGMGKIETAVKSEIARLAKKEIRAVCGPLARDVRELKRTVSRLRRTVASLEKAAREWTKQIRAQKAELKVPEEEVKAARLSPGLIRSLRKRLGLSQGQLATVVGISTVSVGLWEQGKTRPTGSNRAALVALRKLGRRDVRKILELKVTAKPKKKKATRKPAKKKPAKKKPTKKARRKTR